MTDKPFLYRGGQFIDTPTVRTSTHNNETQIDITDRMHISLPAANANALLVALAQHLYDSGTMTLDAAETINYMTHIVLMDPRERAEMEAMSTGEDY